MKIIVKMATNEKLSLFKMNDQIEVLNNLPDYDLKKTVLEFERLMNFKAPQWDKGTMTKRQYIDAMMSVFIESTDSINASEAAVRADKLVATVKKETPDTWQKIVLKLWCRINPFNLLNRKN